MKPASRWLQSEWLQLTQLFAGDDREHKQAIQATQETPQTVHEHDSTMNLKCNNCQPVIESKNRLQLQIVRKSRANKFSDSSSLCRIEIF